LNRKNKGTAPKDKLVTHAKESTWLDSNPGLGNNLSKPPSKSKFNCKYIIISYYQL
jgi:hypothetical protein